MQTEKNIWLRMLSMILTLALLISCVPNQVYAMAGEALTDWVNATDTAVLQPGTTSESTLGTAQVIAEDASRRGEFYKEYIMNNGLRYATVYPSAIHYEEDGQWKDIDNTLVAAISGGKSVYQNKAGAWNVCFPQSLSGSDMIGITKDGFTVQFGMAGEMRSSGDLVVASVGLIGSENSAGTLAVSTAQTSVAQIQEIDLTAARAAAEHPETILDKLNSRLTYANVYPNTNVVYDLQGTQLKESVVMHHYDASLWGYRYTLDTGDLIPVLREDQQIDLCHPETNEVVLTMPAPYMLDNNGEISYDVDVALTRNGTSYLLSYYLPREWLADANRAWPVILDPVVNANSHYTNVKDVTVAETLTESSTRGVIQCGYSTNCGAMRIYMQYINLPSLTSADVIVDATISLNKPMNSGTISNVDVHKVTGSWESTTITWANKANYESNIADYVVCQNADWYTWNITSIVRDWYEFNNYGMVFKVPDAVEEESTANTWKQFYSSDYNTTVETMPALTITYQNHNGLEDYWSYSSASAGRAGTGYVNLFTGNLVWVRNDLGFDGNRMPVSISHIYNANDSQTNPFGMGYGWRTNYNQTITLSSGVYAWEDGDGTRHYFCPAEDNEGNEISNTYLDEDGLHLTLTTGGSGDQTYQLTDQLGNKSYFDASGRLRKIENNQAVKSNNTITYTTDTGNLISTITDGAGRVYQFTYQSNLLHKISYKGTTENELTYVQYTYEGENLVSIEDKKPYEKSVAFITTFDYDNNHLLTQAADVTGYNITYTYFTGNTNRVDFVREYNGTILGQFISFEYSTRYTKSIDHKAHETYYQFNDWGNVVAVHDSTGHTQYTKYALNDANDPVPNTAEPHQVIEVFEQGGATNNTLLNSSFEDTSLRDNENVTTSTRALSEKYKYQGQYSLKMTEGEEGIRTYILLDSTDVEAGETYTFSAYIYLEAGSEVLVKLGSDDTNVSKTAKDTKGQWVRVQVSYTNNGAEVESIHPTIELVSGTAYIDCVQLEKADSASDYCMMPNGDVRLSTVDNILRFPGWKTMDGQSANDFYFEGDSPNSALKGGVLRIIGETAEEKYITQSVEGGGEMGDIFVLSGWAMADAAPLREYREPDWDENRVEMREFGLKLVFHHEDGTFTERYVSFDPNISGERWQYVATTIVATAPYTKVSVQVVYSHQVNVAYFDGIQLYKNRCSTTYAYDGNKNLIRETNILGQTTTYGYAEDNKVDLASITPAAGAAVTYGYDQYHNVTSMVEEVTVPNVTPTTIYTTTYGYVYDAYGNVTSITVTQTEEIGDQINTLQQKSWTAYTNDGNYIVSTTNTYNETTYYEYDDDTGVLKWVKYPGDTDATRTNYSYDDMYRLIGTSAAPDQNTQMSATYTYHKDLLATITTGSNTTYTITYGDYNLRKSVQVGSRVLATYHYSNENPYASENEKRNHNLERLDYGNGDSVKYTYDYLGRVTSAKYQEDGSASVSRVINYVYDNTGALAYMTDSATGIETRCSYDKTSRAAMVEETDNETFYHVFLYFYDDKGNIIGAQECIRFADDKDSTGQGNTVLYEYLNQYQYLYDYKNRLASVLTSKTQKDYAYDGFDRLTEETVVHVEGNTSTPILSNRYTYEDITVIESGTVSEYTGSRVSEVETEFDGVTKVYSYTYDDNGNITSISDGAHTTRYFYDAANQLIREENEAAGKIWVWTYDNAGNILSKKEYAYTTETLGAPTNTANYVYGDASWGDLLTSYSGQGFTYDNGGNLISDGTWAYTWRQGRQLASMIKGSETWTFEYDANGMRTKRACGDKVYTYVYSGSQLTAMTCSWDKFLFTYDAAGKPLTLEYHDTFYCQAHNGGACGSNCEIYYYVTNLQGDVIALLDSSGNVKAEYAYDAWGNHVETPSSFIGNYNPLRYRGYVYDRETGLYYLQNGYYDPLIGRWIQPVKGSTYNSSGNTGVNLYSYANNNPISIAYCSASVSGKAGSRTLSSTGLDIGSHISNTEINIQSNNYPDLSFLSSGFSFLENGFSMITGVIDGYRQIKNLDSIAGLEKASNALLFVGIALNVGLSAYENFAVNQSQDISQRIDNFLGDVAYIAISSAATYGVGYLVAMIPYVGPVLAVPASMLTGTILEQMWSGEDILWIEGFKININGQSLDEWVGG